MTEPVRDDEPSRVGGSFRDPSGFVFRRGGHVYRQINEPALAGYRRLMDSGLYGKLAAKGLLVPHEEVDVPPLDDAGRLVVRPAQVPFVSYPYEWCPTQLKDAAVATLEIQRAALDNGMTLKDASAYNIQFVGNRPVFIDTLSFDAWEEGEPWVAYGQFCRHFLAPLALMRYVDVSLARLGRVYLDGVPLDLASRLLPLRSLGKLGLLLHLHLQGRSERNVSRRGTKPEGKQRAVSKAGMLGILQSLEDCAVSLDAGRPKTVWSDYYAETNYSEEAAEAKGELVREYVEAARPRHVWDLGANTGRYSRIAAELCELVVAFDMDAGAVDLCYRSCRDDGVESVLPLVLDLSNPSPGLGWAHEERDALDERPHPDLVVGLALIHHLAIGNNLPLGKVAEFFAGLAPRLVIEFVPKEDSQVQRMLSTREDVFEDYGQEAFEREFSRWYDIERSQPIPGTVRRLYSMRAR